MLARDEDAKGQWRHTQVTRPVWFLSSKTCSACGTVNRKLKRERTWTCPSCATRHDRNLNAAINLRNLIMSPRPTPEWAGSGGRGSTKAVGFTPRRTRHRSERRAAPPGERERDTDAGTEAGGPRAWKLGSPEPERGQPEDPVRVPQGRRQNGQGQEEAVPQGPSASRQGHLGSAAFPSVATSATSG